MTDFKKKVVPADDLPSTPNTKEVPVDDLPDSHIVTSDPIPQPTLKDHVTARNDEVLLNKTKDSFLSLPQFQDDNPNAERNKQIYIDYLAKKGYNKEHLQKTANDLTYNKKLLAEATPEVNADAKNYNATYKTGTALLGLGKYDDAIAMFSHTLDNLPKDQTNTGNSTQQSNDARDIPTQYSAATNPAYSLFGIGSAMAAKGDLKSAIDVYNEALQTPNITPQTSAMIQQGLAYAKYKSGDKDASKEHLKQSRLLTEADKPNQALISQINEEAAALNQQQRESDDMKAIADNFENAVSYPQRALYEVAKNSVQGIYQGLNKVNEGAGDIVAGGHMNMDTGQIEQGTTGGGALKVLAGGASAYFNTIPQVAAFNLAMKPLNDAAAANPDNKTLQVLNDASTVPFTLYSHIAKWTGHEPTTENEKNFAELADLVTLVGAHKVGLKGVEKVQDFSDKLQEAANGTLPIGEVNKIGDLSQYLDNIKEGDIKQELENHDTPAAKQLLSDIDSRIEETQKRREKLGIKEEILNIPENTLTTLERISDNKPTDLIALNEAKNSLFDEYNRLKDLKKSSDRTFTTQQINDAMDQLDSAAKDIDKHVEAGNELASEGLSPELQKLKEQHTELLQSNVTPEVKLLVMAKLDELNGKIEDQVHKNTDTHVQDGMNAVNLKALQENRDANSHLPAVVKLLNEKIKPLEKEVPKEDQVPETPEPVQEPIVEQPTVEQPAMEMAAEVPAVETPPVEPPNVDGIEPETTKLTHAAIDAKNVELGLDERAKKDVTTAEEINTKADDKIKEGKVDYQKLISDAIDNKKPLSTVDHTVLVKYDDMLNTKLKEVSGEEFDKTLQEIKKVRDAVSISSSIKGEQLGALRFDTVRDDSLAAFMVDAMEASKVDVLTEDQKNDIQALHKEYEQRLAVEQQKLQEQTAARQQVEDEFKQYKAEKEAQKTVRNTKRDRTLKIEDIRKERKDLLDRFKKEWNGGDKNKPVQQGIGITDEMVKIVGQLAANYAKEGVIHLADFVDNIHEDLKDIVDGISKKDIQDIFAGEHKKQQKERSDAVIKLNEAKSQAKLIAKLEKLQSGEIPKEPKKRIARNAEIKKLQEQIKDFKKEHGLNDEARLRAVKTRNESTQAKINEQIRTGNFEEKKTGSVVLDQALKKKFPELHKEVINAILATEDVKYKKAKLLYDYEQANRGIKDKVYDFVGGFVNTAKAFKAGIDLSAIVIQNGVAILGNPKIGADALKKQVPSIISEKLHQEEIANFHNASDWYMIEKSGLKVLDPTSHRKEMREETFNGKNWFDKLPIKVKGKAVNLSPTRPFERAFTSLGNNVAIGLFRARVQELEAMGKTFEGNTNEFKQVAQTINSLIGRADLPPAINKGKEAISWVVWSPKLIASSLNTLGLSDIGYTLFSKKKGFYGKMDNGKSSGTPWTKSQKAYAIKQTVKGIGTGVALMAAAKLGGADVDSDPRSVNFGSVQFVPGGDNISVFGRYIPYARLIAMIIHNEKVYNGKVQGLGTKYGGATKGSEMLKFARGKVTPSTGLLIDAITGKRFDGSGFTWAQGAVDMVTPMSGDDLIKGFNNTGVTTLLTRFPLSAIGLKVSNEGDFAKPAKTTKPNHTIRKPK